MTSTVTSIKIEPDNCASCSDLREKYKTAINENEILKKDLSILKNQNDLLNNLNQSYVERIKHFEAKNNDHKFELNKKVSVSFFFTFLTLNNFF